MHTSIAERSPRNLLRIYPSRSVRGARSTAGMRLRDFDLFDGVDRDAVHDLERTSHTGTADRGRVLFLPGDPSDVVYFVASGRVKLSRLSTSGKEFILGFVERGQFFGETGVLDEKPRETVAEVVEPSKLLVVPADALRSLLACQPSLLMKLARLLGLRQKQLERRLLGAVSKNAPQRVAELLLELGTTYGVRDLRGTLLRIKLSQSAMANLLGVSREIVNHTFADLKRQGIIELSGGRVILRDPRALSRLVV